VHSASCNKKILTPWAYRIIPFSYPFTKVWFRSDSNGLEVFTIIENQGIKNCECLFSPEKERVVLSGVNKGKIWCDIKALSLGYTVKDAFKFV